jgi:hypothetical protein
MGAGRSSRQAKLEAGVMEEVGEALGALTPAVEGAVGSLAVNGGLAAIATQWRTRLWKLEDLGGPAAAVYAVPGPGTNYAWAGDRLLLDGFRGGEWVVIRAALDAKVEVVARRAGAAREAVEVEVERVLPRMMPVRDLAGGEELGEQDWLEIRVLQGRAAVTAVDMGGESGDLDLWEAGAFAEAGCTLPVIEEVTLTSERLEEPGYVRVQWKTAGAVEVDLLPAGTGMLPASESWLYLEEPLRTVLVARNECGEVTAPVEVLVGAPRLRGLTVETREGAAAGAPGELIAVSLENVRDVEGEPYLEFRDGDGTVHPAEILGRRADGLFEARVPLWMDERPGRGYRTGRMEVRAVAGEEAGGVVEFEVLPLAEVAGAAEEFRGMLESLFGAYEEALRELEGIEDVAEVLEEQREQLGLYREWLKSMVDGVAETGAGTLPVGFGPEPGPDRVTLTAADLGVWIAYNRNLGQEEEPEGETAAKEAVRAAGGGRERAARVCLAERAPMVKPCKILENAERLNLQLLRFIDGWSEMFDTNPLLAYVAEQAEEQAKKAAEWVKNAPKKGKLGVLGRTLYHASLVARAQCLIYPVQLQGFQAVPSLLPFVPLNQNSPSTAMLIEARLEAAKKTDGELADYLLDLQGGSLKKVLLKKKIPAALADEVVRLVRDEDRAPLLQVIRAFKRALNIKPEARHAVGYCDLFEVWGKRNGFRNGQEQFNRRRGIIERSKTRGPQGENEFYYLGRRARATETMCIVPRFESFVFPEKIAKSQGRYFNSDCQYQGPGPRVVREDGFVDSTAQGGGAYEGKVHTGVRPRRLSVVSATVASTRNPNGVESVQTLPGSREVTRESPMPPLRTEVNGSEGSIRGGPPVGDEVEQTWTFDMVVTGHGTWSSDEGLDEYRSRANMTVMGENHPQRGSIPRIAVSVQKNGDCDTFGYQAWFTLPDGSELYFTSGPKGEGGDYSADMEATRVSVAMGGDAKYPGNGRSSESCRPRMVVRLYEEPVEEESEEGAARVRR